jgi:hypothetical protein
MTVCLGSRPCALGHGHGIQQAQCEGLNYALVVHAVLQYAFMWHAAICACAQDVNVCTSVHVDMSAPGRPDVACPDGAGVLPVLMLLVCCTS